jgi:hypothetical protein
MSTAGLSGARLARMHDFMAGYVERGEVPGLVTLVRRSMSMRLALRRLVIAPPCGAIPSSASPR